ncbi:helix-turn-helix domain-containing protein [Leptospira levettii]|uniref:helix-turn-helix domain-containing protein n=1 Tax=Leptospira levettii TaxID=2023178 RepID=UPI000F630A82|nr:helix-turn-helix domain-containing protein [Leptospira levettii]
MKQGIYIPPVIQELRDLSIKEQIILAEIYSFSSKGKECFASNEHFGSLLNVKPDTVCRLISKLKKKGYLVQTKFDGRKRFLKLSIQTDSYTIPQQARTEECQNTTRVFEKNEADSYEKAISNSTSTIKISNKQCNNIKDLVSKFPDSTRDVIERALSFGEMPSEPRLKNVVDIIISRYRPSYSMT